MTVERPAYVAFAATLLRRTEDAVLLRAGAVERWVPRRLLCTLTDRAVDAAETGAELEVRLLDWKARELGWPPRPAPNDRRLL